MSPAEMANFADALQRRGQAWAEVPPVRPRLPWSTVSGFADRSMFVCALARSWPMFPVTGDNIALFKDFHFPKTVISMPFVKAIPQYEVPP